MYGFLWVYIGVSGCLWVFGCKSKATCPMKNRRCVGVVTVVLRSCVFMGAYGFLWVSCVFVGVWVFMGLYTCLRVLRVFGCKSKATCPMKNRRCEGVVTVDLSTCVSMGVYGFS